jgi:hypothetical protein
MPVLKKWEKEVEYMRIQEKIFAICHRNAYIIKIIDDIFKFSFNKMFVSNIIFIS